MLPIPPGLALWLAKYAMQLMAVLALVLSITAGYYYWKHQVTSEARDDAIAECNKEKAKTAAATAKLLDAAEARIAAAKRESDQNYIGALQHNAQVITKLNDERIANQSRSVRVRVESERASSSSDTMSGKTGVPKVADRSGKESYTAELATENRKRLEQVTYELGVLNELAKGYILAIERCYVVK